MISIGVVQFHTDSLLNGAPSQESDNEKRGDRPETQNDSESSPPSKTPRADSNPDNEDGYELPLDQIFELLKNTRRRRVLKFLRENGGETTLSEVAEHIAALENDTTVKAINSAQRKRVYVGLYQCHLPKMDDADVVIFDKNRGTIELGPNVEQLEPYLEPPEDREWHKLYMGVTLGSLALFGYSQVAGSAIGLTSVVVLGVALIAITACVVAHSLAVSNGYS
jgi:DNA-binding transcriptional ArsR family regulator